jgi:hypothetical protein
MGMRKIGQELVHEQWEAAHAGVVHLHLVCRHALHHYEHEMQMSSWPSDLFGFF